MNFFTTILLQKFTETKPTVRFWWNFVFACSNNWNYFGLNFMKKYWCVLKLLTKYEKNKILLHNAYVAKMKKETALAKTLGQYILRHSRNFTKLYYYFLEIYKFRCWVPIFVLVQLNGTEVWLTVRYKMVALYMYKKHSIYYDPIHSS